MTFQVGNQLRKGKPVPHSGRKPDVLKAEVAALFDRAVPMEDREAIAARMAARAKKGDVKAAEWVYNRIYGRVASLEDAELAEARTEAAREQVVLIREQAAGQRAQVRYTDVQTEAFKLSTITPEIFERVMLSVMQVPLALLQGVSEEERQSFAASLGAWQTFLSRVSQKTALAQGEALEEVYDVAIPAMFSPDKEVGDDAASEAGDAGDVP